MNRRPRGYVLLINNTKFPNEVDRDKQYRKGSDRDALNIRSVFTNLGFTVIPKDNLTAEVTNVYVFHCLSIVR